MQIPDTEELDTESYRQLIASPINEFRLFERSLDWTRALRSFHGHGSHAREWYLQCAFYGLQTLYHCVEVHTNRRGGVPTLKGTRVTVSEALAELAEGCGVQEVADNFDLDREQIKELINGLSLLMNQPYPR